MPAPLIDLSTIDLSKIEFDDEAIAEVEEEMVEDAVEE